MIARGQRGYRYSGFEFIGDVPADWQLRRLKFAFELQKRPIAEGMGIVTAFRDGEVTLRSNRRSDGYTEGDKQIGYQGIEPGDLVIHAMDAFAGAIGVSNSRGMSTPVYSVCTPIIDAMPEFTALVLRHLARTGYIESLSKGIRERSTDFRWADARDVLIPFPDLDEQLAIVDYLDRETDEIDAFIADQEKLIAVMNERRAATITQAVTKGLHPSAPMKDSGVEWLGDVPESWQVMPLKRSISFLTSGSRDWASLYADEGIPFVRIGNLTRGHLYVDMSDTQHVAVEPGAEGERSRLIINDVLFSITAYLGSVAVVDEAVEGAFISQHVALVRPLTKKLNSRFLGYCVLSDWGQRQLLQQAYGGTKIQLSLGDIRRFQSTVPPVSEQQRIVDYLDSELSEIDAAITDAVHSIKLSKERRSALISAAVTGRIDVRSTTSTQQKAA